MFSQHLLVDAGPPVKTFLVTDGNEPRQVLVPLIVLAEKDQMMISGSIVSGATLLGKTGAGCKVDFAADDRLEPGGAALEIKLDRSEHVAVIGDRNCRHPASDGLGNQVVETDRPVQQGILGMEV